MFTISSSPSYYQEQRSMPSNRRRRRRHDSCVQLTAADNWQSPSSSLARLNNDNNNKDNNHLLSSTLLRRRRRPSSSILPTSLAWRRRFKAKPIFPVVTLLSLIITTLLTVNEPGGVHAAATTSAQSRAAKVTTASALTRQIKEYAEYYDEFSTYLVKNISLKEPPAIDSGMATNVDLFFEIERIQAINEATMEISMSFFLRQTWIDGRIAKILSRQKGPAEFRLEDGTWDRIWTPDVFFRNEKAASFHDVTRPNRVMTVSRNGTVVYDMKLTASFSCQMNLWKYPFDTQNCPVLLESFGHTNEMMTFAWASSQSRWTTNWMDGGEGSEVQQYTIQGLKFGNCEQQYLTGLYPCLKLEMLLERKLKLYVIRLYIPSGLMVILSWISFWFHPDATQARVQLGLLTVLTLTNIKETAAGNLPPVGYIKAWDIWSFACLLFAALSLIEYAMVHFLFCIERECTNHDKEVNEYWQCLPETYKDAGIRPPFAWCRCCRRFSTLHALLTYISAASVDVFSRLVFPMSFTLFSIVYWWSFFYYLK